MRILGLSYAIFGYLAFGLVSLYFVAFCADQWVPLTVDRGRSSSWPQALSIDAMLLAFFGLQHSVMAREGFKNRLQQFLPKGLERSTYVWASSLALALLVWQWRPLPAVLWEAQSQAVILAHWTLFVTGWSIVLHTSFSFDHWYLFGVRQAWAWFTDTEWAPPPFELPFHYRLVRHPIYTGFLLGTWFTPLFTVGHLVLAAGLGETLWRGLREVPDCSACPHPGPQGLWRAQARAAADIGGFL